MTQFAQNRDIALCMRIEKRCFTGSGTRTGCLPRTTFSTAFLSLSLIAHLNPHFWSRPWPWPNTEPQIAMACFVFHPAAKNSRPEKAACCSSRCFSSRLLGSWEWQLVECLWIMRSGCTCLSLELYGTEAWQRKHLTAVPFATILILAKTENNLK